MFTLAQALKAALPIIPKKSVSDIDGKSIAGVHIYKDGNDIKLEVTNNFVLFRCKVSPDYCFGIKDGQKVIIPKKQVKLMLKFFEVVTINFETMVACDLWPIEQVKAEFPDIESAIPKKIKKFANEVNFNFDFLNLLHKSIKSLDISSSVCGLNLVTNKKDLTILKPFYYGNGNKVYTSAEYVVMGLIEL